LIGSVKTTATTATASNYQYFYDGYHIRAFLQCDSAPKTDAAAYA
jgi:hypothetical protein